MKRTPILAFMLCAAAFPTAAQQMPSPAAAQAALQQPGAADAVRARLRDSGLTPEQIRQKLQGLGYSGNLLDSYMGDAIPAGDSPEVSADQAEIAMRALGLLQSGGPTQGMVTTGAAVPPGTAIRRSNVFGVDILRSSSTTQFQPMISGPVPPDYHLGPGDALVLILTGDVELTHQLWITREGFVLIPQVGQVFLSNLTMDQAKSVLYDRLGRVYSGVRRSANATTHFELSVANVRAVQVYAIGEVTQPGAYQVSALGTVLTAIYTAGGVTEKANLRKVEVRRNGVVAGTFDLYDYLLAGNARSDIRLENGDVIYVGLRDRRVAVGGSVQRPALYDVAQGETLRDILSAAGGILANASVTRITIERILPPAQRTEGGPQRVTVDVQLDRRDSLLIPPIALEDEDRITVFGIPDEQIHYVHIAGNVYLPGRFGFAPGMTLSELIQRAGGLQPATYARRAHISRLNPLDQTRRLVSVELPEDSQSPWPSDLLLEDKDSVVVFGLLEMRAPRMVTIQGAVNQDRTVPWRAGMTLRDLILLARGLAPGASLDSAEIARMPSPRAPGQLAQTIRVPLDSTYLFDRDSLGRALNPPGAPYRASGALDILLQPWDHVLILAEPEWEGQREVILMGQVRFPGRYALRNRTERISDLLTRAGGLLPTAYPLAAEFYRSKDLQGRIGIDLPRVIRDTKFRDNFTLLAGDSLFIPEHNPVVHVGGAVNAPIAVAYVPGKSIGYYISAAGGPTHDANESRAYVTQPNGKIESNKHRFLMIPDSHPEPLAGAVVIVPVKVENPNRDSPLAIFAQLASVLASLATVAIVALR